MNEKLIIGDNQVIVLFKDLHEFKEPIKTTIKENIKEYIGFDYYGLITVGYKWIHVSIKWLLLDKTEIHYKFKKNKFSKRHLNNLKNYTHKMLKLKPIILLNYIYFLMEIPTTVYLNVSCCICLEEKQADDKGYFDCIHKETCDDCFNLLKTKICPLCRANFKT